jgi:hypothetical protein
MKMCLEQHRIWGTAGRTAMFLFAMAGCCLYAPVLAAGEVIKLAVSDSQGVYQVALEMILNAPVNDVYAVITDYAHIYRVDSSIVESKILDAPDPSVTRVKTVINDCVLSFCRDIRRVEDVRQVGDHNIYAVIVPQLSNVRSGATHWQLYPIGDKTRINYDMTLEPGFFVPPLVGDYLVEKKIKEETLSCFNNIERIARLHRERTKVQSSTMNEKRPKSIISEHDNAN